MRYAITGATGLLGANLAEVLLDAGHDVVATKRTTSRTDHLDDLKIGWRDASLSDGDALAAAFEGCDGVFHCAAAVSVQYKVEGWIVDANVTGTERVIGAVRAAGVPRLVHCSTVGAVGLSTDGEPCDESQTWNMPDFGLGDAYVTTKRQAEDKVNDAVADGLDAVVVNPTYMIGPRDVRPSSGKLVQDLMKGRAPGFTGGKNNFVDVRDVARGMLLAMEKGARGERYILGGHNMGYGEFMDIVSATTGAKAVTRKVPDWAVRGLGLFGDLQQAVTGKDAVVNSATAQWAITPRFIFTSAKAARELGYTISPLEPAVADCAAWFREHDMA